MQLKEYYIKVYLEQVRVGLQSGLQSGMSGSPAGLAKAKLSLKIFPILS